MMLQPSMNYDNYVYMYFGQNKLVLKCYFCFLSVDTIKMMDEDNNPITLTRTGIAWESDKKYKFQNPEVPAGYTDLTDCKIFSRLESVSCGNFLRHT